MAQSFASAVTGALAHTLAILAAFEGAVSKAQAESPEHYCNYYASHAVRLGEAARSVSSCRHLIEEAPQRWSLNYDQHFSYCMRIYGSGHGMAEDATRTREIRFCAGS